MLVILTEDAPSGPAFGLFFGVAAIGLAVQTCVTYRKGYMYCGRTEVVYRKDGRWKFRFWFGMQILFVFLLSAASVYGFLT
jgi:hypothetical protein